MRRVYLAGAALAICATLACSERSSPPRVAAADAVAREAAPPTGGCPVSSGARLAAATLAGLPARAPVGALWQLCPTARVDTVGVGGTTSPALRFDEPGVTLWAIQSEYEAYGDSLHRAEPADLWAAAGDSLRFPDGTLIPMRVGAIRALDRGVIVVDHGDDGTGSYIVLCRFPHLAIVVSNVWPPFARSGIVPLSRAAASDTTRVWRIEVDPRQASDAAIRQACAGVPAS
ncbi:hypothetical protein [Longimicrobium sp.]|jgi:hypothetical protein|uniref:hypothetical protein n=1 Tax=Longimicrobium sp. TaxID=2029185 RepID=UPI002F93F669